MVDRRVLFAADTRGEPTELSIKIGIQFNLATLDDTVLCSAYNLAIGDVCSKR